MQLETTYEISEYAKKKRREYQMEYMKQNPEKVKQWRATQIVNAYKKLIKANPQYSIERVNK